MKVLLSRRSKQTLFSSIVGLYLVLFFQNCGKGFEATMGPIEGSITNSSLAAPQISLVSPIPALSNSRSLSIQIKVVTDPQSTLGKVSCQLDSNPEQDCTNLQLSLSNLADGDHSLKISASDQHGTIAQQLISNFRIDATAPVVMIFQGPAAVSGSQSAAFSFSASDALSPIKAYLCSLDNAAFAACTSPVNLSGLAAGSHTFKIRATDSANNNSQDVAQTWTVDLAAPVLSITAKPNDLSNSKSANFSFSGTSGGQPLARYECSLDNAAYATCTSPVAYSNLSDGTHRFSVRGVNAQGAVSSPVNNSWVVDTTAPTLPVITSNITSPTLETAISLTFSATDAGSGISSYACSLNSAAYAACTSPKALSSLAPGNHTFQVRASDAAGNMSAIATYNWTVQVPVMLDGGALYTTHCSNCHGPLNNSNRYNRTAAQIQSAIKVVPTMTQLSNLSTAQVNAIAQALVKNTAGLENPFTCNTNDTGVSVLHRLTKREYTATILDLFSGQLAAADIQNEMTSLQQEFTNAVPSIRVFDSTNPNSMSLPLLMAYNNVATKAADVITANATKMNAIGGTCISAATVTDACVTTFLDGFGLRSYRRPLTSAEKTSYLTLYRSGTSNSDRFARVVQALLMAPQFLYKLEDNGTAVNGRTDLFQLNSYEVATRLSYSILGSMPDQALFDAAKAGTLTTAAGVQTQVERLMGLAKAKEGIRSFYSQWLRLDYIPDIQTTATYANGINVATFKSEARQEIVELMDYLLWTQKVNYRGLMTTNVAIPKTANLSRVYGVGVSAQPVQLQDANRLGILTRAGLLSVDPVGHSNPIKRGVNLRLHLLCDALGSPPADVESLASPYDPLSSTRDQVAAKTSASACMTCHSRINPMGFAFENYDGFGRYRTMETVTHMGQSRTHNIDSAVSPNIVSIGDPVVEGASAMQAAMSQSSTAQACMAKQWLQYSTGRDASASDHCALAAMYDAMNKPGGSVLDMMKAYTGTQGFLLKKLGPLN